MWWGNAWHPPSSAAYIAAAAGTVSRETEETEETDDDEEQDASWGRVALIMLGYGVAPEVWMHWTYDTIDRILDARRRSRDARSAAIESAAASAAARNQSLAVRYTVPLAEGDYGG